MPRKKRCVPFWMFSSARGVAAIVETALEWIDVLVIAAFLGPAAGGVYGAVNRCVRVALWSNTPGAS